MNLKSINQTSKEELALARTFSTFQSVETLINQAKSNIQTENIFLADKVIGRNMSFPKLIGLLSKAENKVIERDKENNVNKNNTVILKNDYILDHCYASLPERQREAVSIGNFCYWLGSLSDQKLRTKDIFVKFIDPGINRLTGMFSDSLKELIGMDEKYVNERLLMIGALDRLDTYGKFPLIISPNAEKLDLIIVPLSSYLNDKSNELLIFKILFTGGTDKSYIISPPMLSRQELEDILPFDQFIKDLVDFNQNYKHGLYEHGETNLYNNPPLSESLILFSRMSHFDQAVEITKELGLLKPVIYEDKPNFHKTENWEKRLELKKKLRNELKN
jgi:hypothetical protein